MRFRKKPIEVEAWQWNGRLDHRPEWLSVMAANPFYEGKIVVGTGHVTRQQDKLIIDTLNGTMTASLTDWIIREVKGEIYYCRADIFAQTYDPVKD